MSSPALDRRPGLHGGRVDTRVARLLPEDVCRMFSVLPVLDATGSVVVAVADPGDGVARRIAQRAIERSTGRRPACVTVSSRTIALGIDARFGPALTPAPTRVPAPARAPAPTIEARLLSAEEPSAPESPPAVAVPPPGTRRLLGDLLIESGAVSVAQVAWALRVQAGRGGRLGGILAHAGLLRESQLLTALSRQLQLPVLDESGARSDVDALSRVPAGLVQTTRVLPLTVQDGTLIVLTADPLDGDALSAVSRAAGLSLAVTLATERDLDFELQRVYAEENIRASVHRLHDEHPDRSAYSVLSRGQMIFVAVFALLVLVGLVITPLNVAIGFTLFATIFYICTSLYRFRLIEASLAHEFETPITKEDVDGLDERSLPTYTLLLPMYREAAVVRKLLLSLSRLDYPVEKLDIKLLVEADDPETRPAIEALDLPPQFRIVEVPDALPKTKPKACNYGLVQARGEYVVIYDAEDEPEPDQLKKVVAAFRKLDDPRVSCIQCKLNYFNRDQNLLTAWFTTEYSMWFDLIMPGLDASDAPIPLGGTSNHFVTADLRDLGAWDPYNVAEDADLGIRLSRAGSRTAVIDSTTFEEATSEVGNWVRQRSRWVKGYMQTWLVHMRHPVRLSRELGLRRFLSFQLVIGGTFLTFLLNPIFWFLTTLWTLTGVGVIQQLFPSYLYYLAGTGLFVGNFLFTYLNAAGAVHRGHHELVKYALLSPIYWGLMSLAAWKGAIQLITKPHYWEKTLHGHDAP